MKKTVVIADLFVIIVFCFVSTIAQTNLKNTYSKIEKKLAEDKNYLDISSIMFQANSVKLEGLQNIPRTNEKPPFNFNTAETNSYEVVFMKENSEFDSTIILQVRETVDKSASTGDFFGTSPSESSKEVNVVLTFQDIEELYFNYPDTYAALFTLTEFLIHNNEPLKLLGIKVDDQVNKSKGISSKNNQDFLNYQTVNSNHHYPKVVLQTQKKIRRSRGQTAEAEVVDYKIDASFGNVSFFYKDLDLGYSTISGEVDMGAKVLNLHPWQAMSLTAGIRSLVTISAAAQNLLEDFIIDARLMGRIKLNTSSLVTSLPFVFVTTPKLNVGSGLILDVSATRAYGMPFINFYLATGATKAFTPSVKFIDKKGENVAYFTPQQWETSMSFYWNTSEEMTLRFRIDIGVANYNIQKINYSTGGGMNQVFNKIQPATTLYLNFAPKNNDFFGSSFRLFDNQLTVKFWLKLLEFSSLHSFRFETSYISAPFMRAVKEWEAEEGASYFSIRYRYGF
ncbi:MAG: hypothetical protein COW85_03110 [Ignavibacteria bacterium CG22_combo_CG10-13_8_21_14_all_37_15]|nr:MAG: hypothetical protein COW85_03110 [Ignavibacteria bacterium CG22_combo_CG10-13_8_21_14_all_37_15]